ncbi:MAG TPA: alpha/beta fold hydrolase [Actinomycetota bacterium]|nr:alpha/beta fold hydrolase [Actinomycetota bacterium]
MLVHGCPPPPDTSADAARMWRTARDYFLRRGYPRKWIRVVTYDAPVCASNGRLANELAVVIKDLLARTGAAKVDIVAHSMGALAARLYVLDKGRTFVRDFVALAGPNHGAETALIGWPLRTFLGGAYEQLQEGSPAYACGPLAHHEIQTRLNGCLTPSGRIEDVDETPFGVEDGGSIRYLSISNDVDELVVPSQSACLNQAFMNDCSDSVNVRLSLKPEPGGPLIHERYTSDRRVLALVYAHITRRID